MQIDILNEIAAGLLGCHEVDSYDHEEMSTDHV